MVPGTKVYRVVFSLLFSLQRLRKEKKKNPHNDVINAPDLHLQS